MASMAPGAESKGSALLIGQFWHLSPDHLLVPVPALQEEAEKRFGQQKEYGEMLVGDQVRK